MVFTSGDTKQNEMGGDREREREKREPFNNVAHCIRTHGSQWRTWGYLVLEEILLAHEKSGVTKLDANGEGFYSSQKVQVQSMV